MPPKFLMTLNDAEDRLPREISKFLEDNKIISGGSSAR
jgi:hypothetical protein